MLPPANPDMPDMMRWKSDNWRSGFYFREYELSETKSPGVHVVAAVPEPYVQVRGWSVISESRRMDCMCQSCVEIDKQVEHYRELLRSTRDQKEIERISRMIAKLYGDRVLLHRNPER
jgi:hypothetical protein